MKNKIFNLVLLSFALTNIAFGQIADRAQINIVHQKQDPNLCIPTCASMALGKFGQNYSPRQIKVLSRGKVYDPGAPFNDFTPMSYTDLVNALKRVGVSWKLACYSNNAAGFQAGMTRIKNSIKYGYPVLVSISLAPGYGHCVLACGFDDFEKMITTIDPGLQAPGVRKMSYEYFEKTYWNSYISQGNNYRWAVFMY